MKLFPTKMCIKGNINILKFPEATCITTNFYMAQIDEYGDPCDLLTTLFRAVHDHCN